MLDGAGGGAALDEAALDPAELGEGGRLFVLREAAAPDPGALAARLDLRTAAAAEIIAARLGDPSPEEGAADAGE